MVSFKKIYIDLQILRNDSGKLLFISTEDNGPTEQSNKRGWIKWALKEYDIDVSAFSRSFIERISYNQYSSYIM
jgi:hypothetical protein